MQNANDHNRVTKSYSFGQSHAVKIRDAIEAGKRGTRQVIRSRKVDDISGLSKKTTQNNPRRKETGNEYQRPVRKTDWSSIPVVLSGAQ